MIGRMGAYEDGDRYHHDLLGERTRRDDEEIIRMIRNSPEGMGDIILRLGLVCFPCNWLSVLELETRRVPDDDDARLIFVMRGRSADPESLRTLICCWFLCHVGSFRDSHYVCEDELQIRDLIDDIIEVIRSATAQLFRTRRPNGTSDIASCCWTTSYGQELDDAQMMFQRWITCNSWSCSFDVTGKCLVT